MYDDLRQDKLVMPAPTERPGGVVVPLDVAKQMERLYYDRSAFRGRPIEVPIEQSQPQKRERQLEIPPTARKRKMKL